MQSVVFMTFWQGIGISLLASTTDLLSSGGEAVSTGDRDDEEQVEMWAKQAQNFLICLEMLGFAVAHFYCFPVDEWQEGYRPVEDKSKFGDKMALGDFVHDLKTILRHKERKKRLTKEKAGNKPSDDSISTVLEEDEELGQSDSTHGLQSLLDNVEVFLESDAASSVGEGENKESDPSPCKNVSAPVTHKRNIHESLRDKNAPRELRQATALLLAGTLLDENTARLLTSDILDLPLEAGSLNVGSEREGRTDMNREGLKQASKVIGESGEAHGAESPKEEASKDDALSSEPTLLLPVSKIDKMLRPSIFTMHSKDEDESDREELKEPSEGLAVHEEALATESLKSDDGSML